jgi:hypothetical protein
MLSHLVLTSRKDDQIRDAHMIVRRCSTEDLQLAGQVAEAKLHSRAGSAPSQQVCKSHEEIRLANDSNQRVTEWVNDRQRAYFVLGHERGRDFNGRIGADGDDIRAHDLAYRGCSIVNEIAVGNDSDHAPAANDGQVAESART